MLYPDRTSRQNQKAHGNIKRLTAKPRGSPNDFFMSREIVKICLQYYYKFFCNTNTMTVNGEGELELCGKGNVVGY